jgi:hypothetical protein
MALPIARAAFAAVALAATRSALACSVCVAGDPLVAAGDAAGEGRQLRLAVDTEWLSAKAAMEGMPGMEERVDQRTLRLAAVASPLPRLNVAVLVPLVRKTVRASGAGVEHAEVSDSGLGDVEVGGRLFLVDRSSFEAMRHHSVALSAGTSLPTGPNDRVRDGVRDEHAQLGTGAFGPYAGVLYRLEQSRWHAYASLSGRWRSENAHGYRYGASLGWTLQGQVQLLPRVAAGLALDGREAWPDEADGGAVPNTGGLLLAVAPSVHVELGRGVWLALRAQAPVAARLRGEQVAGPVVTAGVQVPVF